MLVLFRAIVTLIPLHVEHRSEPLEMELCRVSCSPLLYVCTRGRLGGHVKLALGDKDVKAVMRAIALETMYQSRMGEFAQVKQRFGLRLLLPALHDGSFYRFAVFLQLRDGIQVLIDQHRDNDIAFLQRYVRDRQAFVHTLRESGLQRLHAKGGKAVHSLVRIGPVTVTKALYLLYGSLVLIISPCLHDFYFHAVALIYQQVHQQFAIVAARHFAAEEIHQQRLFRLLLAAEAAHHAMKSLIILEVVD